MGGQTTTAIVTGILTCAALVVGAVALPVVKTDVASPAADDPMAEAEPAPRPALEPMVQPDDRTDEILRRLTRLEGSVEGLRAEFGEALEALEPLIALAREVQERKSASASASGPGTARLSAHETSAIATLRNTISAQAQIQASARIDTDNDGTGEYGGFLEMSGALAGRMSSPLNPPVLSGAFRTFTDGVVVVRSGYCYRIFLPSERGAGVGEPADGFDGDQISADLGEVTWCCYAWPLEQGKTGERAFFTNQGGDVLATSDANYSGPGGGPDPDAAFTESGSIVGAIALGQRGTDGNTWKQVN